MYILVFKQICIEVFHLDTKKSFIDFAIYVMVEIFHIIYKLQYDTIWHNMTIKDKSKWKLAVSKSQVF